MNRDWPSVPSMPDMPTIPGSFGLGTLAGITCNLSTVAGSVFLTNPSTAVHLLTNRLLTLTDTAGQTLVFWGGSPGTGETLDTEICPEPAFMGSACYGVGNWNCDPGWSFVGDTAVAAAIGNDYDLTYHVSFTPILGVLYKISAECTTYIGGTWGFVFTPMQATGTPTPFGGYSGTGVQSAYKTSMRSTAGANGIGGVTAFTGVFSNYSLKKVLTPSATGIYGLATKGGANGYVSIGATFNPNSATFTLAVTSL